MPEQSAHLLPDTWVERYDNALRSLNDTTHMVGIARKIRALAGTPDAAMEVLAGGEGLAGAAHQGRSENRRVGLFAGTFNPLTRAHIALVEAAQREAGIESVLWVCAVASIDKETVARATLADRLAQLMAYVSSVPATAVALVNRGLYVYQARALRAHLAQDTEEVVLVGYDKIVQIFDPRYYMDRDAALDALFAETRILVAPRQGDSRAALERLLAQPENRRYADRVAYLSLPAGYSEDSSTAVRQLAAQPDCTVYDLARLTPPEGAALALGMGAYRVAPIMRTDYYIWRSAWVKILTIMASTVEAVTQFPPLDQLCDAAMELGERGERIRGMLLADAPDGQTITSLLAAVRGL